jgi:hypothetical protein
MSSLDSISSIISVDRGRKTLVVCAALALSGIAGGQTPTVDSVVRRYRFETTMLRPSELVYQTTLERDAGTTLLGVRTITVSSATYAGTPAWLLLETRSGEGGLATDSLFTDITSLRPMHWSSIMGSARLAAEFRGDTAFTATSAPTGRRSMIAVVPQGTFVSGAMLETVLRLLPLQTAWEDSATTLTVSLNGSAILPTRLSVIGEDRVRVPAGTFDCWVVSVRAEGARGLYWITKRDPIVVRSALDVPTMGTAQLINTLTRISR